MGGGIKIWWGDFLKRDGGWGGVNKCLVGGVTPPISPIGEMLPRPVLLMSLFSLRG